MLFAPPMAFRNLKFRLAYAGPATMTVTMLIRPTGIAMVLRRTVRPVELAVMGNL
jgi:hypothetical protein